MFLSWTSGGREDLGGKRLSQGEALTKVNEPYGFSHGFKVVRKGFHPSTVSQVPSQRALQKLNLAHDGIARQLQQQALFRLRAKRLGSLLILIFDSKQLAQILNIK